MCGKAPKDRSAEIAAQQERERQARITAGTSRINEIFGGFDDKYYDGIAQSYGEHYTPQLEEQFTDARERLYFNPTGGSTQSSAFAEQLADLETERQRQLVDISNRGRAEAQNNRGSLASQRANLIGQLSAGSSVDTVAGLAAEQAKNLTATPVYSALGDLFGRFTGNAVNAANAGAFNNKDKQQTPLLFNNSRQPATVVGRI